MNLKEFTFLFIHSFNPNSYKHLKKRRVHTILEYFITVIVIFTLFSLIFLTPKFVFFVKSIDGKVAAFNELKIDLDVDLDNPVRLIDSPLIVIDLSKESLDKEFMLINDKNVFLKINRFSDVKIFTLENYKDLTKHSRLFKGIVGFLLILSLPMMIILMLFWNLIKYFMIMIIIFFVLNIILRIKKSNISYLLAFKITAVSMTILILINLTIGKLINLYFIPYVLYILLLIVSVFTSTEFRFNNA